MGVIRVGSLCVLVVTALALSACGDESAPQKTATAVVAQELPPELQNVYQTSCEVCHGNAGTGAPQSGLADDWSARVELGMDPMLANVMNGYQGMPAMGGCFHCTEDDFRLLIGFMTGGRLQ
jgi:cytochrome c5